MARLVIDVPSRTLSEYRILPAFTSDASSPAIVDISAPLVRFSRGDSPGIWLNIPIVSSAMQAVTGSTMAIGLAQQGGLGVIYCSQPIDSEARMVREVKSHQAGFVTEFVTFTAQDPLVSALEVSRAKHFNTFPVVEQRDGGRYVLGIVEKNPPSGLGRETPLGGVMRPFRNQSIESIVEALMRDGAPASDVVREVNGYIHFLRPGASLAQANELMRSTGQRYVPIVDEQGVIHSLVFLRDAEKHASHPNQVVDARRSLLVAAAINTHDYKERVPALVDAGVDVLVIDSSQGFSEYQQLCIQFVRDRFAQVPLVGGNIVTSEGFDFLYDCGVGAVRVGMGPGTICITAEQKGMGRGQATAIRSVAEARDAAYRRDGVYVPIIADGGMTTAKDMVVALALGADMVMLGNYLAGTDEAPNPVEEHEGRLRKRYWGEGSNRARMWRGSRYEQSVFEEGKEGFVDYVGPLDKHLALTLAKIRATMSSAGCRDVRALHDSAVLELISDASRVEGGIHHLYGKDRESK